MSVKRTPQEIIGNRRIRVVALDVDGTLVDQHEQMPQEIVEAVRESLYAGIHIVICTARSVESVLKLFGDYFSANELCSLGYVTLGGSHAYRLTRKDGGFVSSVVYAHSYAPTRAYREQVLNRFLTDHTRVIEKTTSLLVDVGDAIKTKRYARILTSKLKSRPLKVYQYHDKICISLKRFNKDRGLREYLKHTGISSRSVVRIADQGGPFEADYELLHNSLGFSVGTHDPSDTTRCHRVYTSTGEGIQSLPATAIVLRAIQYPN